MIAHINDVLYNKMWVVKEWVELFCNLQVLSVDPGTSSDCYKCENHNLISENNKITSFCSM